MYILLEIIKEIGFRFKNLYIKVQDFTGMADLTKEYSATTATVIIADSTYQLMQKQLASLSLWTDELQYLHDNAVKNSLLK